MARRQSNRACSPLSAIVIATLSSSCDRALTSLNPLAASGVDQDRLTNCGTPLRRAFLPNLPGSRQRSRPFRGGQRLQACRLDRRAAWCLLRSGAIVSLRISTMSEGYGLPTPGLVETRPRRPRRYLSGPACSGKGMAGLIDLIRRRKFSKSETLLSSIPADAQHCSATRRRSPAFLHSFPRPSENGLVKRGSQGRQSKLLIPRAGWATGAGLPRAQLVRQLSTWRYSR